MAHFSFPILSSKPNGIKPIEVIEDYQAILTKTADLLSEYKINDSVFRHSESGEELNSTPEFIITKGLHIFNFEMQLPAYSPASFVVPDIAEAECLRAFIVYNIKVEVVNLIHHVSHSRERDILVFRSMDLTQYPKLKDKITLRKEFSITEFGASTSLVQCELKVNKCAFVPGEMLIVDVFVKNGSAKPIELVQLSLFQAQLFVFGDKSKKKELILKIPITIGSDPVKEASFGDNKKVVPCYAMFDYETGAVVEYVPMKVTSSIHRMLPVYRYYKPAPNKPAHQSLNQHATANSRSTIHQGQTWSLSHSLSSVKLDDSLSQQIANCNLPTDSDSDVTSSKDTCANNSRFDRRNFDQNNDIQSISTRDSMDMSVMPTMVMSQFKYYLSEESSDITESIW